MKWSALFHHALLLCDVSVLEPVDHGLNSLKLRIGDTVPCEDRYTDWNDTTIQELPKFLGVTGGKEAKCPPEQSRALPMRSSQNSGLEDGQKVCFADVKHPCYKMAYFHELSSRVSFQEARLACESEGGVLLSLENEAEQKLIESMLQNLTKPGTGISDGDFWIGLWRNGDGQTSGACPDLYQWSDGSSSQYRNWYTDEPSCGSEKCVVMYHQPTANPGLGGPYLYQWNDDRCNMKHNYICKYEPEISPTDPVEKPYLTNQPTDTHENVVVTEAGILPNLIYVIIPTIPLLLLILVAFGTCCFQMLHRRKARRHFIKDSTPLSSGCLAESLNSTL